MEELFHEARALYLGDAQSGAYNSQNELIDQSILSNNFNDLFIKNISNIFKEIYKATKPRFYHSMKSEGRVMKLLIPALSMEIYKPKSSFG